MKLSWLLKGSTYAVIRGSVDIEVSVIVSDSRQTQPDCVFVCVRGNHFDGHSTICQVLTDGACAVIVEKLTDEVAQVLARPVCATIVLVEDTKSVLHHMWNVFCQFPLKKLTLVGITGTKGKTTTAMFLRALLEAHGEKTGLIGTNGIFDGERWTETSHTTPEPQVLFPALQRMGEHGCYVVVMEVSSIGMKQKRLSGIFFDYALFTNFSVDHIGVGEHASVEEYFYWKKQLFFQCRQAVFYDLPKAHEIGETLFVPTQYVKVEANAIQPCIDRKPRVAAHLTIFDGQRAYPMTVTLSMAGEYNVENAALALTVCARMMGKQFSPNTAVEALQSCRILGRMEVIYAEEFLVMIDYAHNEESLRQLLRTLREYHPKRLVCLFGCGGNRSHERRYGMGRASGKYADYSILTEDNSRDESCLQIIRQIEQGILQSGGCYEIIPDRREAIEKCIQEAKAGDWIVLAGKGHEEYMEKKGVRYAFSEREIVDFALKLRQKREEMSCESNN